MFLFQCFVCKFYRYFWFEMCIGGSVVYLGLKLWNVDFVYVGKSLYIGFNKMKVVCKVVRVLCWNDLRVFLCGSMEVMVDLGLGFGIGFFMLFCNIFVLLLIYR